MIPPPLDIYFLWGSYDPSVGCYQHRRHGLANAEKLHHYTAPAGMLYQGPLALRLRNFTGGSCLDLETLLLFELVKKPYQ